MLVFFRARFDMNSSDIITRIRVHLGQPLGIADPVRTQLERNGRLDLARLAMLTQILRSEANQVGTVPKGYPVFIDFVMRGIHRLLPWYTRPLQNFSRVCAEQAEEIGRQIGVLAHVQSELLA